MRPENLVTNLTPGAQVTEINSLGWRLRIPAGKEKSYRLAQLDDYAELPRRYFTWRTGSHLKMEVRASSEIIPGTWGFGLWNDPFSMGLLNRKDQGSQTRQLRWPALPNAAWFFYASSPNYLSLHDNLPAQDGLAATFQSNRSAPAVLFTLALFFPSLIIPSLMRLVRRLLRNPIKQSAVSLGHDPTSWHSYQIEWEETGVVFRVDGRCILSSKIVPREPLGLVIWIDNQYLALPPSGKIRYGFLPNPEPAWIEVRNIHIDRGR